MANVEGKATALTALTPVRRGGPLREFMANSNALDGVRDQGGGNGDLWPQVQGAREKIGALARELEGLIRAEVRA